MKSEKRQGHNSLSCSSSIAFKTAKVDGVCLERRDIDGIAEGEKRERARRWRELRREKEEDEREVDPLYKRIEVGKRGNKV